MAINQRLKTLPTTSRLPSIGTDIPEWLQEWLIRAARKIETVPRQLNTFVAIGPNTGSSTSWVISHGLNNPNVVAQVRLGSNGTVIYPTMALTDTNTITITSAGSIQADSLVVVVLG